MNTKISGESILSNLKPGEAARVKRIDVAGEACWRLMDLGLVPDTRLEAVYRGPFGQPVAYRIRGALIALRKEQAAQIIVELETQQPQERE